jgi:CelD/BcsL family acetyltransferase involved in cellulose biosynthesis
MALAPAPVASLAIEVVSKSVDITRFAPAWHAVFEAAGVEPSTSFEWTAAMLQHHLRPGDKFFLLQTSSGGRVSGYVPLVAKADSVLGQGIVVLSPISDRYCTHGQLLMPLDQPGIDALMAAMLRLDVKWDVFRMSKVLENGPLPSLLESAARTAGLECDVRYGRAAYVLDLPDSFDTYFSQRTSKFRGHLKRTAKKVEAMGRVDVTEARTPQEFDYMYDALLEIERASWKHDHGTAISAVAHQTGFYRTMGRAALDQGRLHLQMLAVDGTPIAHNMGYVHGTRYAYLKTSFDDRHRTVSPAAFLRTRLIASLIERGVRHFDFHGEPYEWERQWTDTYNWHKTVTIYNRTPKGIGLRWLNKLKREPVERPVLTHCDPLDIGPRRR